MAWMVGEYGEHLTTDVQSIGERPSIGEAPDATETNLEEMGEFLKKGFNMAYALSVVSTLDGTDPPLVKLPANNHALTEAQRKTVSARMGISSGNHEDMRELWKPYRRRDVFRTHPAVLTEALEEIASQIDEGKTAQLRRKQVVGVLSSYAQTATETEVVKTVEERDLALLETKPKFSVSPEDLGLAKEAEIIFCLSRNDDKSVLAWRQKREEEQWLGASSAASCLGNGMGHDAPEQVYESLMFGAEQKEVTNGMIAGIERQEAVLESLIVALESDGWKVGRALPRFGEVSVVSSAKTPWDVATVDSVLRIEGGQVLGQDYEGTAVVEIKVPDSMPFIASWSDWEEVLGADGKLAAKKIFTVPEYVAAQVQDQMRITGIPVGIVAALAPNWEKSPDGRLPLVKYEFLTVDSVLQEQLWEGKKAMRRCVETSTPPSLDKEYYQKLSAHDVGVPAHTKEVALSGSVVEFDKKQMALVRKHQEALDRQKEAKQEVDALRSEIERNIGTAELVIDATTQDEVATYKRREGIDIEKFLAQPDVNVVYLDGQAEDDENINWSATLSNNPLAKQAAKTSGTVKGAASLRYKRA